MDLGVNEELIIGKFYLGSTTKIHIAADAHSNPVDFKITLGKVHDAKVANTLIEQISVADNYVADKL